MQGSKVSFKFIHISDLHIANKAYRINFFDKFQCKDFNGIYAGSLQNFKINKTFYPSTYDYQVLAKMINFMKNMEHDFVLITGDISSTGMEDDLKESYNIIDHKPIEIIKDKYYTSFSKLESILLLPGNHDRYMGKTKPFRESSYKPGGQLFDKFFDKYWKNNSDSKVRVNILAKKNIQIALFRIDFSLNESEGKRKTMFYYAGRGKVYNNIIKELKEKVEDVKNKYGEIPLILANHFHPFSKKSSLELRNSDKLIKVLETLNIKYLFCGHTHIQEVQPLKNIVISCAGTLCGLPDENAFIYHILDVKKNKGQYTIKLKADLYKRFPNGTINKYGSITN